jgi:flagellar biosynthetic protein FliR
LDRGAARPVHRGALHRLPAARSLRVAIEAFVDEILRRAETGQILAFGTLLLARVLPVTFIAPFFGGPLVPAPVKIAIALALATVLYPAVRAGAGGPLPEDSLVFVGLLLKELLVGFALAFVATLIFRAAEMAGQLVDVLRGANLATALVPELGERQSTLADLWTQTLVLIFIAAGGHHLFLAAFADSYTALPIGSIPAPKAGLWPSVEWVIELTGDLFRIAFTLAAPALVALFLADVVLGLAARVAPQIQVFFLGMPVKAVLALAMIFFALEVLLVAMRGGLGEMMQDLRRLVDLFR